MHCWNYVSCYDDFEQTKHYTIYLRYPKRPDMSLEIVFIFDYIISRLSYGSLVWPFNIFSVIISIMIILICSFLQLVWMTHSKHWLNFKTEGSRHNIWYWTINILYIFIVFSIVMLKSTFPSIFVSSWTTTMKWTKIKLNTMVTFTVN